MSSPTKPRTPFQSLDNVDETRNQREFKSNNVNNLEISPQDAEQHQNDWEVEVFGSGRVDSVIPMLKPLSEVVVVDKESQSALYRIETLVSLVNSNESTASMSDAILSSETFCALVGQSVHLFDADMSQHLATINLDCQPEITAVSRKSRFIVVGDALGTIHFVHVASQSVVFSQEVASHLAGKVFSWMNFVGRDTDATESLIVVLNDHVMLRFSNLDLAQVEQALLQRDMSLALKLKSEIKVEPIMLGGTGPHNLQVNSMVHWNVGIREERLVIVGAGKYALSQHRKSLLTSKTMMMDGIADVESLKLVLLEPVQSSPETPCRAPSWMLLLDGDGNVSIRDTNTLVLIHAPSSFSNTRIEDMVLVSASHLAVLTQLDSQQRRFIRIISIPDWIIEQEVEVEKDTKLVRRPSGALGIVCYVERVATPGQPVRLAVRQLCETAPQQKLQQLMNRKRWQDALDFAQKFSLSPQLVYKAKLLDIVSESIAGTMILDTSMLTDLEKVEDVGFKAHVCLRALPNTLQDAETLLTYAHNLVTTQGKDGRSITDLAQATQAIQKCVKRLGTFQLLTPSYEPRQWARFRDADMVQEIRSLLRLNDLTSAVLLWRRHHLDEPLVENIMDILQNVPDNTPPQQIYAWLHQDVFSLLNPSLHTAVGGWLERRARLVESMQKKPHQALKLTSLLTMEPEVVEQVATPAHHVASLKCQGEKFTNALHSQLEDLAHLWDKHELRLTLAEYAQETPRSIALELLDRVGASELLPDAIVKHFKPYVEKNGLNPEEILFDYAMEVMEAAKSTDLAGSSWETRTLTLLDAISVQDTKIDIVLEIMRRSPIPWSLELDQAIRLVLAWTNCVRVEEVKEQYRLMLLKKMLLRHGIKLFNVADLSMAKELLNFILSRTDVDDAMDDALMVVNAYHHLSRLDAYATRLRNLCQAGQLSRAVSLLKTGQEKQHHVEPDHVLAKLIGDVPFSLADSLTIGQEVVEWAVDVMDEIVTSNELDKTKFSMALDSAVELTRVMSNLRSNCIENLPTIPMTWCDHARYQELSNIKALFVEFDQLVTVEHYRTGVAQQKLLSEAAKKVFSYSKTPGTMSETSLYRLAELLNIPRDNLKGLLAEEAARCGDFKTAMVLCKAATEKTMDSTASHVLKRVATSMTTYGATHPHVLPDLKATHSRLTEHILNLSRESLTCVGEDGMSETLEAFKAFDVQHSVFLQSSAGEYDLAMEQGRAALDFDHLFPFYKETALVLPLEEALPLAGKYAMSITEKKAKVVGKGKQRVQEDDSPLSRGKQLVEYLVGHSCRVQSIINFQLLFEMVIRQQQGLNLESGIQAYQTTMANLLQTMLSSRNMDERLALGYMLCLPQEMAFDAFKGGMRTTGQDYHRLLTFGALGQAAGKVWMARSFQVDCESLSRNAKWWHQLRVLDISFDDASFRNGRDPDNSAQRNLVPMLLEKTGDLETVLEFGRDYNLEDDFVLFAWIKLQLLQGSPGYQNRIASVLEDVVNQDGLTKKLMEEWIPRISPYDYDRLMYAHRLVPNQEKSRNAILALEILQGYTRKQPPEYDELVQSRRWVLGKDVQVGLEILQQEFPYASQRLPYHHIFLKEGGWKYLETELEVDSLGKLLPLHVSLNIHADKFYKTAISKLIRSLVCLLQSCSNSFKKSGTEQKIKFADVKPWVVKLSQMQDAVEECVYVAQAFPLGQERILAYRFAEMLAGKWKGFKDQEKQAEKAGRLIGEWLAACETEFDLIGLKMSEFAPLCNKPGELIAKLYEDKGEEAYPFIEEVAKRHKIDLDRQRGKLYSSWLQETPPVDDNLPSLRMGRVEELALQRKLVSLLSHQLSKSVGMILKVATEPNSKVTTLMRIRSLCVLFQMATPSDLPQNLTWNDLQGYLKLLLYLADFEELRIPQTLREFDSGDKEALARSLWVNHGKEPKAVQLICNICLDYHVLDVALWENVLSQLEASGNHTYLFSVLQQVGKVGTLSQLKCLPTLWKKMLMTTLQRVLIGKEKSLDQLVQMVQACPWVLAMEEIANGLQGMMGQEGVPVLIAMAKLGRWEELKSGLSTCSTLQLMGWMNDLGDTLEGGQIGTLILSSLNLRRDYSLLESSPHLGKFIQQLVENDDLDGLILWMVSKDDLRILQVMTVYLQIWPERLATIPGLPDKVSMLYGLLEGMLTKDLTEEERGLVRQGMQKIDMMRKNV